MTPKEPYNETRIEYCPLHASAPALLAACEAASKYVGDLLVNESTYRPAVKVLHQLNAAIAEASGQELTEEPYLPN
jgi:hypothetical protein